MLGRPKKKLLMDQVLRQPGELVMHYDDLTGILTTVGVWGALLLSILVGLLSSMPKDHLDVGDIRYGIIYNDLVCGPLLDFLDVNGSLRRRAGVPLDDHACFPYPAQLSLRADLNLSGSRLAAIERLITDNEENFKTLAPVFFATIGYTPLSDRLLLFGLTSGASLVLSLLTTMLTYCSVAWLPAKEIDQVLVTWLRSGKYLVIVTLLLVLLGTVLFFLTFAYNLFFRFPYIFQHTLIARVLYGGIFSTLILGLYVIYLHCHTLWRHDMLFAGKKRLGIVPTPLHSSSDSQSHKRSISATAFAAEKNALLAMRDGGDIEEEVYLQKLATLRSVFSPGVETLAMSPA